MLYQKISLIIPSYNRLEELKELFPSLEEQTLDKHNFELIIVDDGSDDGTVEFLNVYHGGLDLKYYQQTNQGPGSARNLGLKNCSGDFIIFIDSDVIAPAEFLMEVFTFINLEQCDAYGGPDKAHTSFSPFLKAVDYAMTSFITTGGLRGKKGKKLAKYFPRSFNMGLSKSVYEKIGGFGSLRHGQDIEFSNRIIKSGAKVLFIEKAFVYHKRRTSIRKFFKQVFNWGVARINLYKLDRSMLEFLHTLPAIATAIFILILALSFVSAANLLITKLMLLLMFLVLFLSSLDAVIKYRTFTVFIYVPITMFTQIFAYGLGFIYAYSKRILFGASEFKGFSKNYYK